MSAMSDERLNLEFRDLRPANGQPPWTENLNSQVRPRAPQSAQRTTRIIRSSQLGSIIYTQISTARCRLLLAEDPARTVIASNRETSQETRGKFTQGAL